MIAQERPPALGRRTSSPRHVLRNRGLPNIDAELEEFAMDPRRTPERVCDAHVANELAYLQWLFRPPTAWSRFPTPVGSEPRTMPTDHCLRPNHGQCVECRRHKPRQPNKQQAID